MAGKFIIGALLTTAVLVTTAVLAGCSSAANPASGGPAKTAASRELTCKQRYLAWKNGPAKSAAEQFTAAQTALSAAASKNNNVAGVTAAAEADGRAAARLGAFPVPACADPHGYLAQALTDVRAAAANAASANGLSGLVAALAPLKAVPALEGDFTAELKHTTGV